MVTEEEGEEKRREGSNDDVGARPALRGDSAMMRTKRK
jgi:hypothetical protein